ncbi:MAG: sigma-70 family RNA polymerase sigma factor [Gammaproteobacteria bacterium]|nr:sigma-70 family RNA polymerase sigma factor [Gammaproteobacteria bacterium]
MKGSRLLENTDEALMQLVCRGDHPAFAELVRRHTSRFFALAYRTLQHSGDAEDVVQAAFIKLWQNPYAWQSDKSRFTTWFYRVILNACYDHQRKHDRSVPVVNADFDAIQQPVESEQARLESRQQLLIEQGFLETAIKQLPAAQRDALNLVVYSELPQKQAAEIMGVSLKALESLLVRARCSLAVNVKKSINRSAAASLQASAISDRL